MEDEVPNPPAILIVEDDSAVRKLLNRTLVERGWRTLLAGGGMEAISVVLQYDGPIPLAIVDLVMPSFGGLDFANQLRLDRPSTKVLYMSGQANSIEMESLRREAPGAVLRKPFTTAELLEGIRGVLAQ
jgi:two-component system, cell cycle sensor histidine kinase and response regulator CckA